MGRTAKFAANPTTRAVTGGSLRKGDEMNDPSAALQHLRAALDVGDRDAVMACFAPDATLSVLSGKERIALTSGGIGKAVDTLIVGFDNIKLTPISRQVSESQIVQESVVSGDHTGSFAGAEPTSSRVHVNVKLTATAAPDSKLQSLLVEADTRALYAQIAKTDDGIGAASGMLATVRERYDGGVRVIGVPKPGATSAVGAGARPSNTSSRRRWAALTVAPVLLLIVFLAWRHGSIDPSLAAADHPAKPVASTRSTTAAPSQTPKPTAATSLPAIAIAVPKSVPHVQAGRQVVLNSDVLFGFDSSTLTPGASSAVTSLAEQLRTAGVTGTIQVNGYTDDLGTVAYDLALSRDRALAVARVLQAGLAGQPVILAPQGFGQANPVAPNDSDPNRARNRRVTIVLPTAG